MYGLETATTLYAIIALVICVLIVKEGEAATSAGGCRPSAGTTLAECTYKRSYCERDYGVKLKFAGVGCKKLDGTRWRDGGCQCDGFCGYHCRANCQQDSQCEWHDLGGVCYSKINGRPGPPMPVCVTSTPTTFQGPG